MSQLFKRFVFTDTDHSFTPDEGVSVMKVPTSQHLIELIVFLVPLQLLA